MSNEGSSSEFGEESPSNKRIKVEETEPAPFSDEAARLQACEARVSAMKTEDAQNSPLSSCLASVGSCPKLSLKQTKPLSCESSSYVWTDLPVPAVVYNKLLVENENIKRDIKKLKKSLSSVEAEVVQIRAELETMESNLREREPSQAEIVEPPSQEEHFECSPAQDQADEAVGESDEDLIDSDFELNLDSSSADEADQIDAVEVVDVEVSLPPKPQPPSQQTQQRPQRAAAIKARRIIARNF